MLIAQESECGLWVLKSLRTAFAQLTPTGRGNCLRHSVRVVVIDCRKQGSGSVFDAILQSEGATRFVPDKP
ncbi:hypothetical protein C2L65_35160 [Paraburkholderia terrae]|uniref:Uncharacterized protein n=1 Tax=Paraburkholderia terrae TaxID=311230 RepID=A0A2I8EZ14_9BURK|nr:hypothetical protein C2L65_35160 [Paraburkholderia terrae]